MKTRALASSVILGIAIATQPAIIQAGLLSSMFGDGARALQQSPYPRGKKTYGPNTLGTGQIKQCMLDAHRLDTMDLEIEGNKVSLDKDRRELERIDGTLRGKPPTDKAVLEHRANVKAFNDRLPATNAKIADRKALGERFHASCDGKTFFLSDLKEAFAGMPPAIINELLKKR